MAALYRVRGRWSEDAMGGSSKMVSFGEAMIRFLPQEDLPEPMPPSAAQQFLRCVVAALVLQRRRRTRRCMSTGYCTVNTLSTRSLRIDPVLICSTIGGDEMNVCLDLQLLGVETVRSH